MKTGFLESANLYPQGSSEGSHTSDQQAKMKENEMNYKANQQMHDMMNRGGEGPQAPWYTPNFPKGCQYNSPGCSMDPIRSTSHASAVHQSLVTSSERWKELYERDACTISELRFCYTGLKDEDVGKLFEIAGSRHGDSMRLIDLAYNDICDAGAQAIAAKLANKEFMKGLVELRLYANKVGELGHACLKGLMMIRKGLKVVLEEPEYLRKRD